MFFEDAARPVQWVNRLGLHSRKGSGYIGFGCIDNVRAGRWCHLGLIGV
jgi:hypothetical protein